MLDSEKNKQGKDFLINFLKLADLNIEDIKIKSKPIPIELLNELEKNDEIDDEFIEKIKEKGLTKIQF